MDNFMKKHAPQGKDTQDSSESLMEMITLLKEYERQCQENQDFTSAQEVKNKIEFLKTQEFLIRKKHFEEEDKENVCYGVSLDAACFRFG